MNTDRHLLAALPGFMREAVRHPAFFLLGFLAASVRVWLPAFLLSLAPDLPAGQRPGGAFSLPDLASWMNDLPAVFTTLTLAFAGLLGIWLAGTIAEGGLIVLAGRLLSGQPVDLAAGLRAGWRWLVPIILLDTLVFFPLFCLFMLILMIPSAALILAAWRQGTDLESALTILVPAVLCVLPLLLLLLPAGFFTAVWRPLALRALVLSESPVRRSARTALLQMRHHASSVFLLFLVGLLPPAAAFVLNRLVLALGGQVGPASGWPSFFLNLCEIALITLTLPLSSVIWTFGVVEITDPGKIEP